MSQPLPNIFRSAVGRRVLLLFLVTALVPLAAMALLSLSQVRELLLEQASTRLANAAKSYATGLYERLLNARDAASAVADQSVVASSTPPAIARGFVSLASFHPTGRMKIFKGTPAPETSRIVEQYRGMALKSTSLLLHTQGGKFFLLQSAGAARSREVVVGELNPEYIWGAEEDRKAGSILCVVEGVTFAYLYCPQGKAMDLPAILKTTAPGRDMKDVVWEKEGVPYRSRIWPQFMLNDFGSPDWYVAMSVPEDEVLAAVYAFRRGFFPVVVLAVLLIAWLSMRQIRAMLVPLEKLTTGTRRLAANDFSARVEVTSQDEFGELGEAFNSMSARLGRQFQVSKAHGEIDRLILERNDLDEIVQTTLHHARVLLPTVQLGAVLLDRGNPDAGRVLRLKDAPAGIPQALAIEAVAVPPASWPNLSAPVLGRHERRAPIPEWLQLADPQGQHPVWVQPLVWGKAVCGWLFAIQAGDESFAEEHRRTIGEIASRLAVAVASAWREDELFQRAHYDALTGLPNRRLFNDRLELEIARCRRDEGHTLAVMFIDLDHFKSVNDSQGHGAGDALLCEAANRIRATIRESDTVSRHGGDEFTVLLTDFHGPRDALQVGQNIISALSEPFIVGGQHCFLSATIGIALFPDNGETPELLLKHADTAMYRAKASGRGQVLFFEERMNAETVARLSMDKELRRALENSEFVLHYQPQVDLKTEKVNSAEALVRWNHPVRGMLSPGHFIGVAEEGRLIHPIGRWVLEEACRQMRIWRHEGLPIERVSVNVSANQFREESFVDHVRTTVVDAGLASSIELEITESVLLEQGDLLKGKLEELSEFGCTIALDDFGTGFSSLAYLKRLPVDAVKIDRVFVEDIDRSSEGRAFVEAMIVMSHALGKWVVAEGAERHAQVVILRSLGCDLVQGFFHSRPLPAGPFAAYVRGFDRSGRRMPASGADTSATIARDGPLIETSIPAR